MTTKNFTTSYGFVIKGTDDRYWAPTGWVRNVNNAYVFQTATAAIQKAAEHGEWYDMSLHGVTQGYLVDTGPV